MTGELLPSSPPPWLAIGAILRGSPIPCPPRRSHRRSVRANPLKRGGGAMICTEIYRNRMFAHSQAPPVRRAPTMSCPDAFNPLLREQERDAEPEPPAMRPVVGVLDPVAQPSGQADRLRADLRHPGNRGTDRHRPPVAVPVVSAFGVDAEGPCLLRRVAQERLPDPGKISSCTTTGTIVRETRFLASFKVNGITGCTLIVQRSLARSGPMSSS